jgi:hypothetical protein
LSLTTASAASSAFGSARSRRGAGHQLHRLELGAERGLDRVEGLEPGQVRGGRDHFQAGRRGVVVVVHQLQQVEIVVVEEFEVHLRGALGGGVLVAEVVPDGEGRPVDGLPRQRGPHPLDLVHGAPG